MTPIIGLQSNNIFLKIFMRSKSPLKNSHILVNCHGIGVQDQFFLNLHFLNFQAVQV